MSQLSRGDIEKNIARKFNSIKWDHAANCHDEDLVYDLVDEFRELFLYYKNNLDYEISIEIVHIYRMLNKLLSRASILEVSSQECREWTEEALLEIEQRMDDITNLNRLRLNPSE